MQLDWRLSFGEHLQIATPKAIQCGAGLARLILNIGGPREAKRRLVASVVQPELLYAAPVWASALQYHAIQRKLFSAQRSVALWIVSAYRIVSASAVLVRVVASVPPRHRLAETWQTGWHGEETGRWIYLQIPDFAIFPFHKKNVYLKKNVVQIKHIFNFCILFHLLNKNFIWLEQTIFQTKTYSFWCNEIFLLKYFALRLKYFQKFYMRKCNENKIFTLCCFFANKQVVERNIWLYFQEFQYYYCKYCL